MRASKLERVQRSILRIEAAKPIHPDTHDTMIDEISWFVRLDGGRETPAMAQTALHRIPLNVFYDLVWEVDNGMTIPAEPVLEVCAFDRLDERALKLVSDPDFAVGVGAMLVVFDPLDIEDEWRGLGVAELLVSSALVELCNEGDVLAVVTPVLHHVRGRERSRLLAEHVPVWENVGFKRIGRTTTWALGSPAVADTVRWRLLDGFGIPTEHEPY